MVYTSQEYHRGCLFQRNRYLVDHSAYCVCYLLQERTGTSYTAQYAREQGLEVRNLAQAPWKSSQPPQRPRKTAAPGREGRAFPGRAFLRLWGFTKVME